MGRRMGHEYPTGPGTVDLPLSDDEEGLGARTLEGEGPESFLIIVHGDGYRLGVTMEGTDRGHPGSIELMVRLYRPGEEIDSMVLAARSRFLSSVQDRGYSVLHLDHGWVCCTMVVEEK
jgi:hypothetical protein